MIYLYPIFITRSDNRYSCHPICTAFNIYIFTPVFARASSFARHGNGKSHYLPWAIGFAGGQTY
jgi:hypothetical protein